ncbi:hypothetical protein [Fodinibius saliphilus]|uniref:hypothetical protein n=1 Tax=Fodinibius saliphilus TaxID=1920650 RepID=UPI0014865407|nr:hypothetical protein [Fodinibius saliphilus]
MSTDNNFFIQIGQLLFNKESTATILLGVLLLGVMVGLLSIIHINNPDTTITETLPLFFGTVIPILIIIKGFKKAVQN